MTWGADLAKRAPLLRPMPHRGPVVQVRAPQALPRSQMCVFNFLIRRNWCTGEVEDAAAAKRENLKDALTDREDGTIPASGGGEVVGRRMLVRSAGGHREHVCVEVDYVRGDTWEGWQVWHIPRYVWDRGKQQWPAVENMDALTLADAKQHIRRWRELRTRDFTSPPNLQ